MDRNAFALTREGKRGKRRHSMKNILPWILVAAFAAVAGTLYFSNSSQKHELETLRGQVAQVDSLNSQLEEVQKQATSQNEQIAAMHKDNDELLKLRNQVRQLADEKAALNKQLMTAQSQVDRSQAEIQQVQQRATENAKTMAEQQILQMRQNQTAAATCINNLRQIDGAKNQWALEHQKGPDAVPLPQDIAPYFPNTQIPQCPAGGRYTLNAVNKAPTCSIPGHTL
jgi:cell division protein FtsN